MSKVTDTKEWVENRPYLFHAFAYVVILVALALLVNSNSKTSTEVKEIKQLDPCIEFPNSEACSKDLSELVRNLTPDQSLVVLCKALRAIDNPCITVKTKNGKKKTVIDDPKGGGNLTEPGTQGLDEGNTDVGNTGGDSSPQPPSDVGTQGTDDPSPPEPPSDPPKPPSDPEPDPPTPPTPDCDLQVLNNCVKVIPEVEGVEVPKIEVKP